MKSIFKIFFAVLILVITATGFTFKPDNTIQILVQSTDTRISSADLSQSAEIISNRLTDFTSEKFELSAISGKNQIKVVLRNNQDMKLLESLMTQKGTFGFYETYTYQEVSELLKGDENLKSLFKNEVPAGSTAQIGCTTVSGVSQVNEYLNSPDLDRKCRFAWSNPFEEPEFCLYALRLNDVKGAVCNGADIESFVSGREATSQENYISFSFKKSVVQLWAEITKRNIGKAVAIVLDGKVILAPVIQDEIANGNCTLTGGFTSDQVKYIAAIGANGELPVSFKVLN